MKNILTTVATATLFTSLALSSVTAKSILCFDGNISKKINNVNISVDRAGLGTDVNLTLVPTFTFQGASFDLVFENGGIPVGTEVELCVEDSNATARKWTKVGALQGSGTPLGNVMVNPKFSFIDDATTGQLIKKNSHIIFNNGACTTLKEVTIVGTGTATCKTVTAEIKNPKSTQAQDLPDLSTNSVSLGKTAQFIKISCTAPQCFVTSNKLKFEDSSKAPGVNIALTDSSAGSISRVSDITTADCPECDKVVSGETTCSTSIIIQNSATADVAGELNVTKLNFVAKFAGTLNSSVTLDLDHTGAKAYTMGRLLSNQPVSLSAGEDVNISLTFKADGKKEIGLGMVSATISNLVTNANKPVISSFKDHNITNIKIGAQTQFTVPYMSGAGASQANFVKISTVAGGEATSLSAMISDSEGNSCNVTLKDVPKNGGSTFIFASKLPSGATYQALIPTGTCANLTSKLYSVKFTAGASVNAVGFMRTKRGERTIDIF